MTKACLICGGDEASGEQLLEAPCQRHWVCTDDVASFFERATENESLYPPKCCGQLFLLDVYETYVPFDVSWNFQMKAQGEYSVLAKYRVYCANPTCSKYLNPATHLKDPVTGTSYAVCQEPSCGKITCTKCKALIEGANSHVCEQDEDYKKFKQTAAEKGFQECPTCASTVELAEACNHITCHCGASFCYICGGNWPGTHGCPPYGPAVYDEEGYNQDGYHRITGLNRQERTRTEQTRADHAGDGDSDEDQDDEGGVFNEFHPVLQHVNADLREAFAALAPGEREMFLMNLQIELFEERGITFGDPEEEDEEDDFDGEEDIDREDGVDGEDEDSDASSDTSSESNVGEGNDSLSQAGDEDENEAGQGDNAEQAQAINEQGAALTDMTQHDPATVEAVLHGESRGEDSESLSATSEDENQPTIPMSIDQAGGQDVEGREFWKGPPGGWSIDEEL